MRRTIFHGFWATCLIAVAVAGLSIRGQEPQDPQQPSYPQQNPQFEGQSQQDLSADQQHGVARLSIVQGDVNVKRADSGSLVAAVVNAPLMAGDHLQTSPGSRAEVALDSANLVRLAPNTDLGFADLEYHRYQLQLAAGTIQYRVLRDQGAQIEIDTPSIAAKPLQTGEYRIAVLDDGTTQITVRSGELEIYSPRGSEQIGAGKTVLVRGDPSDPEFLTEAEIPRDQFDDWCANRDQTLLASRSYQYVSPDVNGAADLDAYGQWVPSQYGTVWAPQPPYAGWSPYSDGEWIWEPYYGWTWVDYAPWGWAPYHYGRWFWNVGYGWCWWPGPRVHVYWAPALVGFFGWGGFGVGFGGGIGWVALAPYEVFHPWWGHGFYAGFYSRTWVSYNMWRNVDVIRIYRNAAIRGGAMIASYDRFGRPGERFSPATIGQLRQANLFRGAMPVAPTRASLQFSMRRAIENPRLATASQRTFYMHQQPRMLSRVPFSQQQMHLQQAFGRPQSNGVNAPRANYPAPPARNGGWQRFGDPGAGSSYRQSFLRNGQNNSGWHQFGSPEHNRGSFSIIQPNAQPQQNYRAMQPAYRPMQPGPSYRPMQPSYPSVQPGYRTWQPSYRESQPNFRAFQPSYATPRYNPPVAPDFHAPSFRAPSFPGGSERGFRPNSAPAAPSRGWGNFTPHGGGGGGGYSSPGGRRGR